MKEENTLTWKALADPTRRHILDLLRERPRTTGELSAAFESLSRYAVMKHLNVLVEAGLVLVRREGRERWNHLNAVPLQYIYERWLRPYEAEWADALIGFKGLVEQDNMPKTTIDGSGGFHIEQEIIIASPPAKVFAALTEQAGGWYNGQYLSHEDSIVNMETQIGGRFFETWGDGQGMLLATVIVMRPPTELRMMGPMGIEGAVQGDIWFRLSDEGDSTRLSLSHQVVGPVGEEVEGMYTFGWNDLLDNRLRALVEGE